MAEDSTDDFLPTKLILVDQSLPLVRAWRTMFAAHDEVEVLAGDYFQRPADAIISPANSFGIMDGGLDLAIREALGVGIQAKVQREIVARHHGELHVGSAVLVETGDERWKYLIAAPTMRVPENVATTFNAYVAFRAILIAAENFNRERGTRAIDSLVCCGLCTGVGAMPAERCAAQMHAAYKSLLLPARIGRFSSIHRSHDELRRM